MDTPYVTSGQGGMKSNQFQTGCNGQAIVRLQPAQAMIHQGRAGGFASVVPKALGCPLQRDSGMDSEAQKILDEEGWLWDPSRHGYRRDQDVISLEQLDVKGLTPEPQEVISEGIRFHSFMPSISSQKSCSSALCRTISTLSMSRLGLCPSTYQKQR